jgi:hypothetical protein
MRLTDDEKRALRLCRDHPRASDGCYYGLKDAAGIRVFDPTPDANWDRFGHLLRVGERLRDSRNAAVARVRAAQRETARRIAEAHGYRPEFV